MPSSVYRLEDLRRNTLEYLDRLVDMSEAYGAVQKEYFDERRQDISRTAVPVHDGDPLVDPSDFHADLENSAFDEVYDQEILHERLLLMGLVHAVEVFFKALAREGASLIGGSLGNLKFKTVKAWYASHGIDVTSVTGVVLLERLRMRINLAKHTGQPEDDGLRRGRESDALLILPTYEDDEMLSHHIDAARSLVNELTELVRLKVP